MSEFKYEFKYNLGDGSEKIYRFNASNVWHMLMNFREFVFMLDDFTTPEEFKSNLQHYIKTFVIKDE